MASVAPVRFYKYLEQPQTQDDLLFMLQKCSELCKSQDFSEKAAIRDFLQIVMGTVESLHVREKIFQFDSAEYSFDLPKNKSGQVSSFFCCIQTRILTSFPFFLFPFSFPLAFLSF